MSKDQSKFTVPGWAVILLLATITMATLGVVWTEIKETREITDSNSNKLILIVEHLGIDTSSLAKK